MPDYRMTIEIRDVALGDVRSLRDSIMEEHGDNFDAGRGDFTITAQEKLSDNFYANVELDEADG